MAFSLLFASEIHQDANALVNQFLYLSNLISQLHPYKIFISSYMEHPALLKFSKPFLLDEFFGKPQGIFEKFYH